MREHLGYIRNKYLDEATGKHFNLPNHSISNFKCRIIHIMGNTPVRFNQQRISKEEYYIDQLKTREPTGMNDRVGKRISHS
jgi:hypothetical protein